jgi:hypothetical protein
MCKISGAARLIIKIVVTTLIKIEYFPASDLKETKYWRY